VKSALATVAAGIARFALALALACAWTAGPAHAAAPAPPARLVVVTDDHYPPYLFRDDDGRLQGIVMDKWALWSRKTGIAVEVRGMEWTGAQRSVLDGGADVIDGLVLTPQRSSLFEFSRGQAPMQARLYFRRSLGGIRGAADVRDLPVGVKDGSACAEWLRERGARKLRTYADSEALVRAAGQDEVGVFCMDAPVASYFLYRDGLADAFRETPPLYTAALHWAVRRGNGKLREAVQRGFDGIGREELDRIEARWAGRALRSPLDVRVLYALATVPAALLALSLLLVLWNRYLKLKLQARSRYFSTRDALTGLPSRPLLYDRLGQALAHAERKASMVAVLFVDLDRFKALNDTFGHEFGDRILKEAAARLMRCTREADTVARISSDEFVIVLTDVERTDAVANHARTVLEELHRAFDLEGQRVYCTASIGIAIHPGDGTSPAALIQNADIAMYRAKERGRNNFQFFLREMHERAVRRLKIETALRGALERREFVLHYQPRIAVGTGEVTGFEALLRWRHPEYGVLSPSEFVPILEDTDLIVAVGEWVLATACAQIRDWHALGMGANAISVNISARQFRRPGLDVLVARLLAETGIDPGLLELELTESLLMQDPEDTIRTLRQLERYGVRLSVDDFGTGYSSLAYLRRFPIDALKIDRAFLSDASSSPEDMAITLAIINLGRSLGLKVVAEGVETAAQLEFLRAHGCDEMQGFLFSEPQPEALARAWYLRRLESAA
jgi:diguanylate cyclase (GGDEF)-like protein